MDSSFATGFALSASLIVAIGAQNAFVLRQGLRREHVTGIVLFCAAGDALLMSAGVLGVGSLLQGLPRLTPVLACAGAALLAAYGALALHRAARPGSLQAASGAASLPLRRALVQAAGFTLLNPHVYLDTVLLVGSVGAGLPAPSQPAFVGGAALASGLWFAALGYGARLLAGWFQRPAAWRVLDAAVGLTMAWLAARLMQPVLAGGS